MQLIRDFREHPQAVGESYGGHWRVAMGFAATFALCALVCTVHAFVPGLFKHTASRCVARLQSRMSARGTSQTGSADHAPVPAPANPAEPAAR